MKKFSFKTILISIVTIIIVSTIFLIALKTIIIPSAQYAQAEKLESNGDLAAAAIAFNKLADYKDSYARSMALWDQVAARKTIDVAFNSYDRKMIGIKNDGTVVVEGFDYCNFEDWTDIVAVSVSSVHVVGLKADGTVVAEGSNRAAYPRQG